MTSSARPSTGPIRVTIPYASRTSADVARSRLRHHAWVAQRGLWPDSRTEQAYRAADFPLFVARTHPWAEGDDLDLATDLVGWSWLWDDSLDKQASPVWAADALDAYRSVLYDHPPQTPDTPLLAAWRQLLARLEHRTTADWRRRHEAHWEATFKSFLQEAHNNAGKIVPEFDTYVAMRRNAGGMDICLDWVEAVGRYELPLHVHAMPELISMRQAEQDVVAMTNDLFSAGKEWAVGNTDNIIPVLAQEKNCSWQDATRLAHECISMALRNFHDAENRFLSSRPYRELPRADRENSDHFIEAMKLWMRGSLDWHLTCPRYREVTS
ncbi:hypothetical protein HNR23_004457 [Nocardiopsis mwathae]|uniref:Terpene synthase n=1 Tax=Nocardiopsis mwathae TaxID=1472723 RepID=A0A7W9YLQ6_9ACTN|nr:hypothetical protein [Nocardiopsis mwathae]MBB6174397.1 hypothetical protein [Nocardiopsis mwathae]